MTNSVLAGYLSYEFSSSFSPEALRLAQDIGEIKVYFCDSVGLPVFEVSPISGPMSKLGLPLIGAGTIHIRINPVLALKSIKNNDGLTKEEVNLSFQRTILQSVYSQVLQQLPSMAPDLSPESQLSKALCAQKEQINQMLKFIGAGNNDAHLYH
ncbi:hypothetical protein [Rheinheimera hassiensis]|uniref:hypothetical protein n=1 Tax=Rheinheimera hassiensis TaxID=1193627 RepID=UPI001F05F1BB|nr:hypothetical protein [Rheinheimera hassiensis]